MYQKATVLGNCRASSGYQGGTVTNISADKLYNLLDSHATTGRGDLKRKCKDILELMNANGWRITAGIHAGGIGGGGRGADPRSHITINIDRGGSYHIRFGITGSTYRLMEITP
jgi:hypothetical protein